MASDIYGGWMRFQACSCAAIKTFFPANVSKSHAKLNPLTAGGSANPDVMLPITQIKAEGEPAADDGHGGGNEGRSSCLFS